MNIRGTGRSWDEEEIEKWGLFEFWGFNARMRQASVDREKRKLYVERMKILALLRLLLTAREININPRELEWVDGVLYWNLPEVRTEGGIRVGPCSVPVSGVPRLSIPSAE